MRGAGWMISINHISIGAIRVLLDLKFLIIYYMEAEIKSQWFCWGYIQIHFPESKYLYFDLNFTEIVRQCPFGNSLALDYILTWHQTGNTLSSEWLSLLTNICVSPITQPENGQAFNASLWPKTRSEYIDCLVQDCRSPIVNALVILQCCT